MQQRTQSRRMHSSRHACPSPSDTRTLPQPPLWLRTASSAVEQSTRHTLAVGGESCISFPVNRLYTSLSEVPDKIDGPSKHSLDLIYRTIFLKNHARVGSSGTTACQLYRYTTTPITQQATSQQSRPHGLRDTRKKPPAQQLSRPPPLSPR